MLFCTVGVSYMGLMLTFDRQKLAKLSRLESSIPGLNSGIARPSSCIPKGGRGVRTSRPGKREPES